VVHWNHLGHAACDQQPAVADVQPVPGQRAGVVGEEVCATVCPALTRLLQQTQQDWVGLLSFSAGDMPQPAERGL
jgi:hypothetical protein